MFRQKHWMQDVACDRVSLTFQLAKPAVLPPVLQLHGAGWQGDFWHGPRGAPNAFPPHRAACAIAGLSGKKVRLSMVLGRSCHRHHGSAWPWRYGDWVDVQWFSFSRFSGYVTRLCAISKNIFIGSRYPKIFYSSMETKLLVRTVSTDNFNPFQKIQIRPWLKSISEDSNTSLHVHRSMLKCCRVFFLRAGYCGRISWCMGYVASNAVHVNQHNNTFVT